MSEARKVPVEIMLARGTERFGASYVSLWSRSVSEPTGFHYRIRPGHDVFVSDAALRSYEKTGEPIQLT